MFFSQNMAEPNSITSETLAIVLNHTEARLHQFEVPRHSRKCLKVTVCLHPLHSFGLWEYLRSKICHNTSKREKSHCSQKNNNDVSF